MTDEINTDQELLAEKNSEALSEHEAMMAELNARREEEAAIAAAQDAALEEVVVQCDAERQEYADSLIRPAP